MAEAVKKKKKKKRSQAPVALVYFVTMLIFLGVFGVIGTYLFGKIYSGNTDSEETIVSYAPTYNTMYARVNSKGVLADICVVRISPEKNQIIVTPVSPYTVSSTDSSQTLREIYADGGIRKLQKAVDDTFGITTDYYMSVDNDSFETISDILGGIVYTPEEELYYISQDSDDSDVLYPAGTASSIDGKQIRLICQYPVFSEGNGGNMKFLGEVVYQFVNNAFQQVNITKNNLDNMYNILTSNSDTNYSSNDFKLHKTYITEMLSQNISPAVKVVPDGEWTDDKHFTVSEDFKAKLSRIYAATEPDATASIAEEDLQEAVTTTVATTTTTAVETEEVADTEQENEDNYETENDQ